MARRSLLYRPADLDHLRRALHHERNALIASIESRRLSQRGTELGQIEEGDVAERVADQAEALRLAAFDASLLEEVDHALGKLDAGTYGLSEETGEPIPIERLYAVPWARRTVEEEQRYRHARAT